MLGEGAEMLKAKVLPKILEQATTHGVQGACLLNGEGSLLAWAGPDKKLDNIVGAISSSVFASYGQSNGLSAESSLEMLLVENENGRVVITRVSKLVLVLFSDDSVHFGMLRAKSLALKEKLEPELNKIM